MNTFSFSCRINAILVCAIVGFVVGYGFNHPIPMGNFWWLAIAWVIAFALRLAMSLTGKVSGGHLDTQMGKMEKIVFTVSLFIIAWVILQSYLK